MDTLGTHPALDAAQTKKTNKKETTSSLSHINRPTPILGRWSLGAWKVTISKRGKESMGTMGRFHHHEDAQGSQDSLYSEGLKRTHYTHPFGRCSLLDFGFGLVQIYQIIDTCSIVVYNCYYSFNTLLLIGTNIHEFIDIVYLDVYTCTYLIHNITVDSYTFVKQ